MADLSKLKLNGDEYYFKDAEIREAFGNAPGRLIPYGYCQTAAATVDKTVTVSPAPVELAAGLMVAIKFQYANTGSNPTLNVNNLGAITIKRYGTTAAGTSAAANWNANSVVILTYDGTYWQLTDFNNTTYSGMTDAEVTAGTSTSNKLITPARLKTAIQTWAPAIPENVSSFTNDAGYLTSYTETDPTVPNWAKQSTKPTYTAQEVGALPDSTVIPNKTSDLTNDSGFIQAHCVEVAYTNDEYVLVNATHSDIATWINNDEMVILVYNDEWYLYRGYFAIYNEYYFASVIGGQFCINSDNSVYFDDLQYASLSEIPQNTSDLYNDSGFISTETDPTVPSWAKAETKPTYTAAEVGALPDTTVITDEKLKTQDIDTNGTYNLIFDASYNTTSTKNTDRGSLQYIKNTSGDNLSIGNRSMNSLRRGSISLANGSTASTTIIPSTGGTFRTITLPASTGTLALLSDIDNTKLQTTAGADNTEYNLIGTETSNTNISVVNIYNPTSISFAKTTNEGRLTIGSSSLPGKIRLYSNITNATGYTDLISGATSTNTRTITFPDATGTVALTTDIPSVPSWALQSSKPNYTFSELTSHPTTINDYGITDVYTKTEVDGLVSGVLHYKGAKTNTSALPSSGNTIGDVWHITADGSEWAWDGTEWQELGNTVDLTGYLQTGDIAAWAKASTKPSYTASEVGALPSNTSYVSSFNGQSGAITYIPPVTSVNGQTGAVTIEADDKTWNGVELSLVGTSQSNSTNEYYLPGRNSTSAVVAYQFKATSTPGRNYVAKYDVDSYLYSTTPSTNDNSTKVATTAYVDSAISGITHPVTSVNGQTGAVTLIIPDADDHKWNDVNLTKTIVSETTRQNVSVPLLTSSSSTTAFLMTATYSPQAGTIARYNDNSYLISTTPSANDNSTKVATTAYVDNAVSGITHPVTSVNGQTGAVIISVPTEPLAVTLSLSEIGVSIDTSFSNILTALNNKIPINAFLNFSTGAKSQSTNVFKNYNGTKIYFVFNGDSGSVQVFTLTSSDALSVTGYNYPIPYDDTALAARVTALENIPWVTYYTGSSEPSNSQGNNGDIYLQTETE